MTNLQEYLAGTSPNDANSVLRIPFLILPDGSGSLELRFSAGPERGYVLSAAAALTPPMTWTALTNVTTGNDGLGKVTLVTTNGVQFFRVAVP